MKLHYDSAQKIYVVYCSIVPVDFPPDWLFHFAKSLSSRMPVLFIELMYGNRPLPSRGVRLSKLISYFFSIPSFHIWEYRSVLAKILLYIKLSIMRLQGYTIVQITTIPGPYTIYSFIPATIHLFDCTDFYKPGEFTRNKTQLERFDCILVNSNVMKKIVSKFNQNTRVVSTGYIKRPYSLQISRKIPNSVVFIGGISRRINFDLLEKAIIALPHCIFFFIGEVYLQKYYVGNNIRNKQCLSHWKKIIHLPNVIYLEHHSQYTVQKSLSHFTVGIIPYEIRDFMNKHSNPIKLWEYLYAGLPVVSTSLPIVREQKARQSLWIADSPEDFARSIQEALINQNNSDRDAIFPQHSVSKKIDQCVDILFEIAQTQKRS